MHKLNFVWNDYIHQKKVLLELATEYIFLGFKQQVQLLCLLVYTAAKEGAQQFIELIFASSTGRMVFDAYRESSPLPEVIARDHGNEETARYLEDVTKRYSFRTKLY